MIELMSNPMEMEVIDIRKKHKYIFSTSVTFKLWLGKKATSAQNKTKNASTAATATTVFEHQRDTEHAPQAIKGCSWLCSQETRQMPRHILLPQDPEGPESTTLTARQVSSTETHAIPSRV
jgi:hypothetical protein